MTGALTFYFQKVQIKTMGKERRERKILITRAGASIVK